MSKTKSQLAKQYQKKTDKQHILDAPDTYIGSVEEDSVVNWCLKDEKFQHAEYKWISGLYKLFDEGIVNARDHFVRIGQKIAAGEDAMPVTKIEITIDKETGVITILNDGNGIDVEKHPEHNLWIPEMIFGHLRTSTNYDKNQKKIVGGKNGFGFKLVLIYSKWGEIETVDHIRGLKYRQRFENNLDVINKPSVRKCKTKPYTKVSFLPDYTRFGIENLTEDMYNLLKKRTYDIGAVTDKTVRVKFNGEAVPFRQFEQYIDMYIGSKKETKRLFESQPRWEYAVSMSPLDEFTQVSFVNGIHTGKGGKHVEYILNQIVKKLIIYIEKKKKVKVKPATIKEQLMLFVNCVIENPAFDSQTKDYMNTPVSKFGSKCDVSNKFIEKLAKMGIMEMAIASNELKHQKKAKNTDGKKTRSIRGIPKLMDANFAGGKKSGECTLILCEGDSAKAGIVSGLSKEDRNYYGIFPLKGKLMNVLDVAQSKINTNEEVNNIKKIMGLNSNKVYTSEDIKNSLRYGKIVFMTDQDLDGSHIKGLCINLFQSQWKELLRIPGFLGFMNTPIIKATKGANSISFYNEKQYRDWKNENNNGKGWKIKYFKGLGTSQAREFKEYFREKRFITFSHEGKECDDSLDKAFNKKLSDSRKTWLENYNRDLVLDTDEQEISYSDFVDRELIHFSKYDCERSIPSSIDGLKTSLRKILYACFKKKLTQEIKVAQLAGYTSEHSGYHHGENSLQGGIIGMAQEFTGSNNISLLVPKGQFGSRLQGGKDNASPRYIFTLLNQITYMLFPEADFPVLNYLDDDGMLVEPDYYVPILPFSLINGCQGIGTGFSHKGASFNPLQLSSYIKKRLENPLAQIDDIVPYYEGFTGEIVKIAQHKYLVKGKYEIIDSKTIRITELPVGTWTEDYKKDLEYMANDKDKKGKKKKPIIKNFRDLCTNDGIDFTVVFPEGKISSLRNKLTEYGCSMLEKKLKLYTTITTSNMHMFTSEQCLKKFNTIQEIIDEYYPVRYKLYQTRKEYQLQQLERLIKVLKNKVRFIKEQCDDVIDLRRKKRQVVIDLLKSRSYDIIDADEDYKYLRGMRIEDVEEENMNKLEDKLAQVQTDYSNLKATTIEDMWRSEITKFENQYEVYIRERTKRINGTTAKKKKKKVTIKKNIKT